MMMTSGEKVHYNGMLDAGRQIVKAEGVSSLFKGAGANILRGVAGAGVLSTMSCGPWEACEGLGDLRLSLREARPKASRVQPTRARGSITPFGQVAA